MPASCPDDLPALDADELAWLATLPDVESRLVFTKRAGNRCHYRVEHGPFAESELSSLPDRDWTLLVNDVEKHLPEMRRLVDVVDVVPDWRIDDLMVSFAAPGGGVGPHRDNYDVFLYQGTGTRCWTYTDADVRPDPVASADLALLQPFDGQRFDAVSGDVLYLPPGVAHWGVAEDACMTYSIGMRAPRRSDLLGETPIGGDDAFYRDEDLTIDEVRPGYISPQASARACALVAGAGLDDADVALRLGDFVTRPKDWLCPDGIDAPVAGVGELRMHGMARIAWNDNHIFVNGGHRRLDRGQDEVAAALSASRENLPKTDLPGRHPELYRWLLHNGTFEIRPKRT